ncbi:MAG: sigma-70 family RNA polymerase sigma factor [Gemmatimonadales bacterium]|nr:MAG: sigma-70 family RNA polymerase sigma factor [Gemmatimonadales bacterium]
MTPSPDTTRLLLDARRGDRSAFDGLYAHLYDELNELARQRLARFRPGQTLDTSALVHEAYLRLVDQTRVELQDRDHFLALASRAMRFIVVDHARARSADKRGGGAALLTLDRVPVAAGAGEEADDVMALDQALASLERMDPRLGQVVELRFFGGLTHEEVARITGRSVPTVKRDWIRARAWLYRFMTAEG